ncbi:hypothetical protein [Zoogloea sp.]|uniref:hypothetical protein n=1 Tax=Zoogloea sp. TaxID=49181 RepID=UPI0035B066E5
MREIEELFGPAEPEIARVCGSIIRFICSQPRPDRLHLTFSLLKDTTKPNSDRALMLAVQYLCGANAQVLEMNFEFVDEDGEYHPISSSEIAEARKSHVLGHPVTGELLSDFEDRVLVYFKPTTPARFAPECRG